MRLGISLIGLALTAALSACGGGDGAVDPPPNGGGGSAEPPRPSVPFQEIERSKSSGITAPRYEAVSANASWARLWAEHKKAVEPVPAIPPVDFSQSSVVGIFMGVGGCSSPHVVDVTRGFGVVGGPALRVVYRVETPAVCPGVAESNAQIISVDNPDRLPFEFSLQTK